MKSSRFADAAARRRSALASPGAYLIERVAADHLVGHGPIRDLAPVSLDGPAGRSVQYQVRDC